MLAAAQGASRTGESVLELAEQTADTAHQGAVAAILDEAIVALDADGVRGLAQIARLPYLNAEVVDAALGAGFFERALAAGAPLYATDDGWWDMAGPVRDFLATLAGPDPDVLRRAAERYRAAGRLTAALDLLLAAGDDTSAAALLCGGEMSRSRRDGRPRVPRASSARLSDAAVNASPMVLVLLARFLDSAAMFDEKTRRLGPTRRDRVTPSSATRRSIARSPRSARSTSCGPGEYAERRGGRARGARGDAEATRR